MALSSVVHCGDRWLDGVAPLSRLFSFPCIPTNPGSLPNGLRAAFAALCALHPTSPRKGDVRAVLDVHVLRVMGRNCGGLL